MTGVVPVYISTFQTWGNSGPDGTLLHLPIHSITGQNVKQDISEFQIQIGKPATCDWADHNDALGTISEGYDPPNFNAGPVEVRSSNGDFSLLYTFAVIPLYDNK